MCCHRSNLIYIFIKKTTFNRKPDRIRKLFFFRSTRNFQKALFKFNKLENKEYLSESDQEIERDIIV